MTDRYTFAPLLVDASPIPFAAPLDSPTGGVWLAGEPWPEEQPVYSQRISWKASQSIMYVIRGRRLIYVGPPRDMDLVLRPRRRGQRPAGMPRSAWWRMRRGERCRFGDDATTTPDVTPEPIGVWNSGGRLMAVAEVGP